VATPAVIFQTKYDQVQDFLLIKCVNYLTCLHFEDPECNCSWELKLHCL
jgi:hypothetical protein